MPIYGVRLAILQFHETAINSTGDDWGHRSRTNKETMGTWVQMESIISFISSISLGDRGTLLSTLNKFIYPGNIRRKVLGERRNKRTRIVARKDLGVPSLFLTLGFSLLRSLEC